MDNEIINPILKKFKSGKHYFLNKNTNYYPILNTYINDSIKDDENILLPRVIILFEKKEKFDEFYDFFQNNKLNKNLVTVFIHDKKDKVKLRNELYNGVDIAVGTIKSVVELYYQNGISLSILKLIYIELESKKEISLISRFLESMNKGQLLFKCEEKLKDSIMNLESIKKEIHNIDE